MLLEELIGKDTAELYLARGEERKELFEKKLSKYGADGYPKGYEGPRPKGFTPVSKIVGSYFAAHLADDFMASLSHDDPKYHSYLSRKIAAHGMKADINTEYFYRKMRALNARKSSYC